MDSSWAKIFRDYNIAEHDFGKAPFELSAQQIKNSCHDFRKTGEKEVRILCKQDNRRKRPAIFKNNGLFLLPVKNGVYSIIKGEGYVDIPHITSRIQGYCSKLEFPLETAKAGDSEMQHLDYAYATSMIRTFMCDESLVLTIRGRKYTSNFDFLVGQQRISVNAVQTEVDAGYEGRNQVVLVEAKNRSVSDVIIRQLYYPYRQWQNHTQKEVVILFFCKDQCGIYSIWQLKFEQEDDYNSVKIIKSKRYKME